jgi:nucleoside-diphosphate-sugar epimerase
VGDIVDGLLRAGMFESAIGEEFNLASGKETRIIDLAKMINEATDNPGGIRYTERRKWDTKDRLLASIDRAGELIGYEPNTPFEVGLDQTVAWFRDHWDEIETSARFGPGTSSAVRDMTTEKESNA